MDRRALLAGAVGVVPSVGLAGCSSGGIGNTTPEKLRLEAEESTVSAICEETIQEIAELHSRDQEPVREAIASGESHAESSGRTTMYIQHSGGFFFVDVTPRESDNKETFSVRATRDTFDGMCELVQHRLITGIDEATIDEDVYRILDETVTTGAFESSPLSDSAEKALNFFAGIDGGRGIYPIYIDFEGAYYVVEMHYRSGE